MIAEYFVIVKGAVRIGNLENALKEYAKSQGFRDAVKEKMKISGSSVAKAAKQSAEWYAERMREIVTGHMDAIGIGEYSDMGVEIKTTADGRVQISLQFDKTSNLSASLNPDRDPVVLPRLLNTGFHTKKDIWGYWQGAYIHGWRDRDPEEFLQEAVHDFNTLYGDDAKAEYIPQNAY